GTKKYTDEKTDEVKISNPSVNLKAKNILLHARLINNESNFNASENITFVADESAQLNNSQVMAGNVLSIISGDSIDAKQSSLAGETVSLQSRTGDINVYSDAAVNYFNENGIRQLSQINASDELSIHAARNLGLTGVVYLKNKNTTLTAGNNLLIKSNDAFLRLERLGTSSTDAEKQAYFNDTLKQLNAINTTGDITLNAGKTLDISGVALNATNTINLTAGEDINLNPRVLATIPESLFPESRQAELSSRLSAGNQLLISSGRDLLAQSADLSAQGNTTLLAGNNLSLFATGYSAIDSANDNNKDDRYITARVHAGKKLTLAANGDFIANGTDFTSGNDMTLSSGGKMELNAVSNHIYREEGNAYSETVTQKNATLNSGGVLTLLSNGSILFQATQLIAKGALDAAAKGGFLYAQAMEESSHYEKTTTKRKWYGK
ncbi:hemagglutinin repeat-containing protein, partial [Candidatus Symbiopectobacterium sp. NZEC135]|nr:hemagglutinin repeat-containing protein [Candidatus Symbiopectobacterium sp. NZEC135]